MKLLLTSHRFWPNVGGTEIAVEQLATHYAAAGHDVTVATSDEPGSPERETRGGYQIRRFALKRAAKFRFPGSDYRDFVLRGGWDLVHLHGQRIWSTDWLYPFLSKARSPLVFTAHGFAQWHRDRRVPVLDRTYYHTVLPRALRHTSAVTALTSAEKEDLVGFGVAADRIVVIPDGYDPSEFVALPSGFRARHGFGPDEKLVLYAGGFYANKRVDRLVEAVAGLDATLVVLGVDADGARPATERLAAERGARLRVLGRVPREDVLSGYRECDAFALGSDFEGFGLVLLEAMAAGLPFVSTPCGAAPDLAAAGGGLLAPDAAGIRDALRGILVDPQRRAALGAAGRKAAQERTWAAVAQQYLALFDEVTRP